MNWETLNSETLVGLHLQAELDEIGLLILMERMREAYCAEKGLEPDDNLSYQWQVVHGLLTPTREEVSVMLEFDRYWNHGAHMSAQRAKQSRLAYYKRLGEITSTWAPFELEDFGTRPLDPKLATLWDYSDPNACIRDPEGYCEGDTFCAEVK